jgi:hypothetical protein
MKYVGCVNIETRNALCGCNGKVLPRTGHEGPEGEQRFISTLSLTLVLDGGGVVNAMLVRFTLGKETWYPLCRRLGGPQGQSGQVWNILSPTGIQSLVCPA